MIQYFGFGQPWWLLLLPVLGYWFWRFGKPAATAALTHSSTNLLIKLGKGKLGAPGKILRTLSFIALALIITAIARPRIPQGEQKDPNKGIDIMLVCDVSGSMDTKDFTVGTEKISRREALLKAISEFVDNRKNDRVGMVGFAKNTYLLSPLTTDGNWIKDVFRMVELRSGTAIGDGIIAGSDLIDQVPITGAPNKEDGKSTAKRSKVMILVTDGLNNEGKNPIDAADYAKKKEVRIYALEIMDLKRIKASSANDSKLSQVAAKTGGQYFQASDTGALVQIYRQIDKMEKREFEANRYTLYDELYLYFMGAAGVILLFGWIMGNTVWMRLP